MRVPYPSDVAEKLGDPASIQELERGAGITIAAVSQSQEQ
jgi:hypothetical protein